VESGARIDKTCKSTLAFTFPKPLVVMEFDIGGYERAIGRFKQEEASGQILHERYVMPFQSGEIDQIKLTVWPSKIVQGVKEIW